MMIYGFYMNVSSICNCIILFFSINHCWVVNNMDAGKISICNNWIRKWSGAEETIFDLAIFLCIRRRYSLLLSHACIIHIRLLNNGEWSDYTTNISVGTHSFKSLKNMQNSLRTFIGIGNLAIITKRSFVKVEFIFFCNWLYLWIQLLQMKILSASILF